MNASCHLNPNKGIRAGQPALSRGLYTNVTECGCFSVHADKLFKVLGMSAIVPSTTVPPPPAPFVAHFVSDALSMNSPTSTKARECKAFSAWLSLPHFSLQPNAMLYRPTSRRRYCGDKQRRTAAKNNFWRWLATPPSFSPLWFSDPPLFPSPYSLSRCAHCHFFLSKFSFSKLWCVQ